MRSAFDIASYLLRRSRELHLGSITPLKLQKLLYYSQAWSLVLRKKRLFGEDLEAWVHGPVVPYVYWRFKQYGFSDLPIPSKNGSLNSDETRILDEVLETYGLKSAKFLEKLSHSEYPWINAREGLRLAQNSKRKISLIDMMNYYMQFTNHSQRSRINSLALQIKKMQARKKILNPFSSGIGSSLDIMPTSSVRLSFSPNDFSSSLSDAESTCSDWEKVGADIQSVFDVIKKIEPDYE